MIEVGDIVTFKSKAWFDSLQEDGEVESHKGRFSFGRDQLDYCGLSFRVTLVDTFDNCFKVDDSEYWFEEWMCKSDEIEELEDTIDHLSSSRYYNDIGDIVYITPLVTWLKELLAIKTFI